MSTLLEKPIKVNRIVTTSIEHARITSYNVCYTKLLRILLKLISSPNIASKIWVYGQYDHEVGIRTVVKPGQDSSVLRLDNGKYLSIKMA